MTCVAQRIAALSVSLITSVHPVIADVGSAGSAVRQVLAEFHETYRFPGATVAYATEDGTVEAFAIGYADVEAGIPDDARKPDACGQHRQDGVGRTRAVPRSGRHTRQV
jgi:hypothetical protein